MSKGNISVQVENIFPIIKKFLYSDHEIFLRELISNAVDATTKVKTLAAKGEVKGELGDTKIEVKIDAAAGTLHIIDQGIGMSEDEVNRYLNQVAFSSAEEFLAKYKDDAAIIGHFGLGFYSAFMVADKVQVITKSYRAEDPAVMWECEGNPEYTLTPAEKTTRGTEIILYINEENKEYLESYRIRELLNKYCKFLPVEIKFGTKTESTWEGEGDEKQEIKTEVDDIINNPNPIWKMKPADLSDDDYREFYRELYPMSEPPLFWIHLNIDYPFNLTGILYFPKLKNNFEIQKNKIQLYSNQVFITDDVKEIVPEFLMLLQGVIDSPDIPLNVSRSYLQSDANVKKINTYISKKVAEKLQSLFKSDRKAYEEKWSEISTFVKYGMISDEKFNEKANAFTLFKNIDGAFATPEEYKEQVKGLQTDKNNKIVYIYTNDKEAQYGYIQAVKDLGYDVLEMDTIIDNHFMQHIEYKGEDVTFVRVDSDTADNIIQKDEVIESVLSQAEQDTIKEIFTGAIQGADAGHIELKAMSPTAQPIVITKPEFMRRMKEMQAMQGMDMNMFPDMYNIQINTNHPLIAEKLLKMRSADKKADFAAYLHDLALLNQGMLSGEALSKFIARSLEFVK
ncbi:MAG: molecular chaperone HtpG [Chitinophagales bacterium]|nr:molecular chaperone HtpG [Chitinophagales bacterium]